MTEQEIKVGPIFSRTNLEERVELCYAALTKLREFHTNRTGEAARAACASLRAFVESSTESLRREISLMQNELTRIAGSHDKEAVVQLSGGVHARQIHLEQILLREIRDLNGRIGPATGEGEQ